MIRKNSLLCKLNRIKTSSKSLFIPICSIFSPIWKPAPSVEAQETAISTITMGALSLISDPERNPKRNFAFSVYSVKAADMPTLSSLISSSRIPVTACSLSPMSSASTLPGLPPLSRSASVPASLENSFSSGSLSGNPINRSGWASWPIPKPPTRHSGSPFRKKKTIPFSHQTSHGSLPIPFSSPMPIQFFHHLQAHGTARRFLLLTFPSSDHTAEGWRPSALSFMMNKNITRRSFP